MVLSVLGSENRKRIIELLKDDNFALVLEILCRTNSPFKHSEPGVCVTHLLDFHGSGYVSVVPKWRL